MQDVARDIRQSLIYASETKIVQVVRMVDSLAVRGPADDLIKPLRVPFGHAMPAKPLSFSRLLFLPLDTMIVTAPTYRAGRGQIPRTAIMPITNAVRAAMDSASGIETLIAERTVDDRSAAAEAGALLWSSAGQIISRLETCPGWAAETGLPGQAWHDIQTTFLGAMFVAGRIWGDDPPGLRTEQDVAALIRDIEENVPESISPVLSLLLSLNHNTTFILSAAARHSNRMAAASNAAVAQALEKISSTATAKIGGSAIEDAAAEANQIEAFLQGVEGRGNASKDQIRRIRRETASQCADRLDRAVQEDFTPALASESMTDEAVTKIEGIARSMRDLEVSGRTLSASPRFEASSAAIWALLVNTDNPDMDPADRARIGEIIFGTDRAEELLRL